MPILSTIGRRHWKTRLLIGIMYLLLVSGAVTMVYPFLLMMAGSTKSSVDAADQRVIPAFLADETALYRKHIEGLFNESLSQMRWAYGSDAATFQKIALPPGSSGLVPEWKEFLDKADLPSHAFELGYLAAPQSRGTVPSGLRSFKHRMERVYGDDIERLNDALGTTFASWKAFFVLPRNGLERRVKGGDRAFDRVVAEYVRCQPLANRYYFCVEGFYKIAFLKNQYTTDIAAYNASHGTVYASWNDVHLPRRIPDMAEATQLERDDWERFVRGILGLVWIRADASAAAAYREFLAAKYKDVSILNSRYSAIYAGFEEVPFPCQPPDAGVARSDWESFLQGWRDPETGAQHRLPADSIVLDTVETRFQDWLQAKYGTLEELNRHLGSVSGNHHSAISAWHSLLPPQREFHYREFQSRRDELRWEFATRNFRSVGDYIFRHGRALVNTALYCGLAVLCALVFNPLAAYALSRYRPRSTYKLLLFLMLTMAFPPMVTQIPVFLMLREFNLLNTFAALILPGLANGYTIFLLKGFFDSLPRELYECAQLDGAGEFRLFWQITMRLSTPILAVTALGAFTAAYTNFMMALLLCQDERMWTIMPWLYQLQAASGQGVVFASLMLASIPTLAVFVLCQKVIMRGIVVPVEK